MSAEITKVANVIIAASDQDRVVAFYTDVVGLEKRVELPFGDGNRWIEVAPAGAETAIAICPPGPTAIPGGKDTGISLATGDIEALHGRLKEQGADVDAEISRFGDAPPLFWFRDPEGNTLMAVQAA
ncbi:MAG TPA: VOC family protein [Gaiellaceae bacterium]|nr:VOC family protein [Gaiellaceae bacterium]